jgi:hypothetical protein
MLLSRKKPVQKFKKRSNLSYNTYVINSKKIQLDDTLVQYFINSCKSLYVFRAKQSPIIRSSIELYLQHLVFINRVIKKFPATFYVKLIRFLKSDLRNRSTVQKLRIFTFQHCSTFSRTIPWQPISGCVNIWRTLH